MLEIYLTKTEDIIFCNDVYFNSVTYSNVQKEVRLQKALEFIENVSYCNGMVISKFTGMPVDLAKISTGAKTYLNILSNSNKIFSLQESGYNIINAVYQLSEGKVYMPFFYIPLLLETNLPYKIVTQDKVEVIKGTDALWDWSDLNGF